MKIETHNATEAQNEILIRWVNAIIDAMNIKSDRKLSIRLLDHQSSDSLGSVIIREGSDVFEIRICTTKLKTVLPTLCHEMVHVDQILSGALKMNPKLGIIYWDDQVYSQRTIDFYSSISKRFYRELPWEKEAFDAMYVLASYVADATGIMALDGTRWESQPLIQSPEDKALIPDQDIFSLDPKDKEAVLRCWFIKFSEAGQDWFLSSHRSECWSDEYSDARLFKTEEEARQVAAVKEARINSYRPFDKVRVKVVQNKEVLS